MEKYEFDNLLPGDIVRQKTGKDGYTIISSSNLHKVAQRIITVSNPSEWNLVFNQKKREYRLWSMELDAEFEMFKDTHKDEAVPNCHLCKWIKTGKIDSETWCSAQGFNLTSKAYGTAWCFKLYKQVEDVK